MGAALHDIGKTRTTREEEIDGKIRITSPYHAVRGRSMVAPDLLALGLSSSVFHRVLGIVGHHHAPKNLVRRSAGSGAFARLSRAIEARLVYQFERADLLGRECPDLDQQLEWLDLFRIASEEAGTWDADPYESWRRRIGEALEPGSPAFDYVLGEAMLDHEAGEIRSVEEALARSHGHRESHPSVTVLCGPSGAGKSSWVERHAGQARVISLDRLREEIAGRRDDQSKNGQVMQAAKEQLREVLRAKGEAIWDATSLRQDGRAVVIALARRYHAMTRIVVVPVNPRTAIARNGKRAHPIPNSVLQRQFDGWEWPEPWEAHAVQIADQS